MKVIDIVGIFIHFLLGGQQFSTEICLVFPQKCSPKPCVKKPKALESCLIRPPLRRLRVEPRRLFRRERAWIWRLNP